MVIVSSFYPAQADALLFDLSSISSYSGNEHISKFMSFILVTNIHRTWYLYMFKLMLFADLIIVILWMRIQKVPQMVHGKFSAVNVDRTRDFQVFNLKLSQLSYAHIWQKPWEKDENNIFNSSRYLLSIYRTCRLYTFSLTLSLNIHLPGTFIKHVFFICSIWRSPLIIMVIFE